MHLEDVKQQNPLQTLLDSNGQETTCEEEVIDVLHDYYADLYSTGQQAHSEKDIRCLLSEITSIPKVVAGSDDLGLPITEEEVQAAIKSLHLGKSLGSDGLTADFYKHFSVDVALILSAVFNECYKVGSLTLSQRLAIIVLIFKDRSRDLEAVYFEFG